MRIALIGQAAFGKDVLSALLDANENVVAALCPPDLPNRSPDPVKDLATSANIPVFQYSRMRDKQAIEEFSSLEIDLCVMAFVTDIVPSQILEAPKLGTIQYHPSLLPEHRGPSSMNWPIIQGKNKTGLTIFWPDEGLDTGPILLQKETEITPDETLGSLYFQKLYPMGIESIIESVHMVKKGTAPKIEQDHSKASYEGWCQSEDAIINWGENADQIYNLIRGCDPSPGANTKIQGCPISFFKASLSPTQYESTPGTVVEISENWFKISALQGSINVGRVQLKGTPKIMADEFIKTNKLGIGDTFR